MEDLEKEISKRKEDAIAADEELERCRSQLDTLKLALEAKEKVLKRIEEKCEADAQEWKEKEACFEAQLLEMGDLREKVDQLSTVEYNPYRPSHSSKHSRKEKMMELPNLTMEETYVNNDDDNVCGVDTDNNGSTTSMMETDDHSTEVRHLTSRSLLFHQSRWRQNNGQRLGDTFLQGTKVEPEEQNSSPIQIQDE